MEETEKKPMAAMFVADGTLYVCPCGERITANGENDPQMSEWMSVHGTHTNGKIELGTG